MSVFKIVYQNGAKMMRPVQSRAEYLALRGTAKQKYTLEAIRIGNEDEKRHLVQMNYSCLPNEDGSLKGSTRMSTSVGMDIDHIGEGSRGSKIQGVQDTMEQVKERILAKKDELGLLMLERSARAAGYHLVFRRHPEMDQEDNLRWASNLLGVAYDEGAKDITRVFFTTTADEEELLYLDDEIFRTEECSSVAPSGLASHTAPTAGVTTPACNPGTPSGLADNAGPAAISPKGTARTQTGVITPGHNALGRYNPEGVTDSTSSGSAAVLQCCSSKMEDPDPQEGSGSKHDGETSQLSYKGFSFSDIIAKYWELFNDDKEPVEGDRNMLTFELAMTLRGICGYSLETLMKVIPNYWHDDGEEWKKTLESALKEPRKSAPYRLKQVLAALKPVKAVEACGGTMSTPPPMPKKLPPLIKLLTKNEPDIYKPAVANAVFPALGAHLHGVKFRYWDNVEHEGTFMNVIIGRQSIGKGCIKKPVEYIMADIKERDEPNRKREDKWKENNPSMKQKKDPRPTDICIQMLIDNLTDAVFNRRIVDANNNGQKYVYTIVDEIEALKKLTSKQTVDEVGLLIRKAFDNSMAGQERVGADSVSGIAPLRWNFNASTTSPNARRFFKKMVNDGTVSRLDISTIIVPKGDEDEAPIKGIYDEAYAEELKPYLERLEAASGLIECPQAKRLSLDMRKENNDKAKLYESDAYRVFSYRANVIAWLKGMVLYVAHGYKWSKEIADFVRWSQQYNLWCKMLYFGQQLEDELREETEIQSHSGPQNLLNLLPDEFTKEQMFQMRQSQGRKGDGLSTLRCWQARGYICLDDVSGRYCKTEEYKQRYGKRD